MTTTVAPGWGQEEGQACRQLLSLALEEDLGARGDLTSTALLPEDLQGQVVFVAHASGVIAGLPAVQMVYEAIHADLRLEILKDDGESAKPGDPLARISGKMRAILTGERTALNFLQRLSGVASLTNRYVQAVAGLPCRILDTRKTTPGWRRLEKYAVRCGGGQNHRMGLFDGILIKDNHLAALASFPDPIAEAIRAARNKTGPGVPVEVEVDDLNQLDRALAAQPDIILLDNMDVGTLREAVHRRDRITPTIKLEASGGITLANIRAIAETGVDFISVGALTHSAPALDVGLDYQARMTNAK